MGKNLPPEKGPEKVPGMGLAERIKQTAQERDGVTERLLASMLHGQSSRTFIEKVCKLGDIEPPKGNESLAYHVFLIQKDVLGFKKTDTYDGCDGKLGPITFNALIKKFPSLNPQPRQEIISKSRSQRAQLVQKSGLPPLPKKPSASKESLPKGITPAETVLIGDSLTAVGYAPYFYRGTSKYNEYKNRLFRSGRKIKEMRQRLEKYCPPAKAYVIGAAANDIYYGNLDDIENDFRRIIEIARKTNPNAKIVLMTLHGKHYKGWSRSPKTLRKIDELNRRLRAIANQDSNISIIDINQEIEVAERQGKKVLQSRGLHYNSRGAKATARLIQDYLATGKHGRLTDYV